MPTSTDTHKQTLLDWFHHWELTQPQSVYLTQPNGHQLTDYTWAEVGDQARRMAAHLKSLKLAPRSSIGLLSKNCAHWFIADLAIWMSGHVTVPLYPTLNAETARHILDHAEVKLLFIGKLEKADWESVRSGIPGDLPLIALPLAGDLDGVPRWDDVTAKTRPAKSAARRKPEELATIVYTSGSTGKPKGVMISFGAMLRCAEGARSIVEPTPEDRMISYLPLAHAAERAVVEAPSLRGGCRVYFADSLSTFIDDLRRARPTLFLSVPRLWTKFYLGIQQKLPLKRQKVLFRTPVVGGIVKRKLLHELGLDYVRYALTGAAPLPPHILEWYREIGLELIEGYGMSENFAYSHANRAGSVKVGTVGQPMPGVHCRIADNGEILVKSPCNMMGYYRDEERTQEAIDAEGWLHTGDRGEIDEKGRLRITGRVKELFKTSKGKYVAPAPIENRLMRHPKVEAVCVAGAGRPQPFALMMLSAEAQAASANAADRGPLERELADLLDEVNAELEPHEVLDFVAVVKEQWTIENGFLTPTMKIKRDVIEKRYEPEIEGWASRRRKVVWG
ncbi:MAG: AMP-binding acetyl-CoA synthetase [Panacagrimonas sp.]|nr:AMP-binding protein [Panacagrimonas sp.]MCC2655836.1 AMP-binding acetyl-CoA synthetase [Panacagrimonas sp.]